MKKRTEIVTILDKSASMRKHTLDVIRGLNSFIEQQKGELGEANFTLVQFNERVKIAAITKTLKDTPEISSADFCAEGQTALYDAIGLTVESTSSRLSRLLDQDFTPSGVIICIMTDGEENASSQFTLREISKIIRHKTEVFGWKFYFFAATEAAALEGQKLGIPKDHLVRHDNSSDGFQIAYKKMEKIASQYRIEYNKEGGTEDVIKL